MNIIEISIGNKKYKISCNTGEEERITKLSKKLDNKYKTLEKNLGHKASEGLILVIMGLILEDEIDMVKNVEQSQKKLHNSEKQIKALCARIDGAIAKLEKL